MKFYSITKDNSKDFDALIASKPAFVKFYMNGCVHCEAMAHAWTTLKHTLSKSGTHLVLNVIEVESGAIHNIHSNCAKNIMGFPTIMKVSLNGEKCVEYNGDRSTQDMMHFIQNNFMKVSLNTPSNTPSNTPLSRTNTPLSRTKTQSRKAKTPLSRTNTQSRKAKTQSRKAKTSLSRTKTKTKIKHIKQYIHRSLSFPSHTSKNSNFTQHGGNVSNKKRTHKRNREFINI